MIQKILGSRRYTSPPSHRVNTNCLFAIVESALMISYMLALVYCWEIEPININYVSYAILVLQFVILAITVLVSRGHQEIDVIE